MVISPIMGKKKKKGKNIWAAWNRTSTATFLAKNILSLSVPFCSDLTHFLSPRFINQSQKKTTVLVECQFSNLRLLSQYGEFWSGRWRDFQERKEKGHTREGHTKESFDNRAFPERLKILGSFTGISSQVQMTSSLKLPRKLAAAVYIWDHILLVEHQLIFLFLPGSYVITIFSRQCLVLSFMELNTQLCLRIFFLRL